MKTVQKKSGRVLELRIKDFLRNSTSTQWVSAFILATYITLVRLTSRIIYIDRDDMLSKANAGEKLIFTLWHGRLVLMPFIFPKKSKVSALISAHKDGRLVSKIAHFFQKDTITGSSSNGGAAAIREMVRALKKGNYVFVTPDGPHGPRMQFQAGAVEVARLSDGCVVPVSVTVKHAKILKSWDKFMLPRLFNTIVIQYGASMSVKTKDDRDVVVDSLEMEMNDIQYALDLKFAQFPAVSPEESTAE